ncbi:MAG: hypothetical protein JNK12_17120 [Acidimicrobiales bacterium]|nr:hypothetical protein [Acidimicrobiales bacterium]
MSPQRALNAREGGAGVHRGTRAAAGVLAALALVSLATGCGSGDESAGVDPETGATTTVVAIDVPKGSVPRVLCKDEVTEDQTVPTGIEVLVTNLVRQASLADAEPYGEFVVRCDNTGVTTIEAPAAFGDVEPTPSGPPQTTIRVATDFGAPIESAPVINFFAAPVGGSQYPTLPGFTTLIQQSADGSLSSGTRDPREGTTIADDCQALPVRDLATGQYTGKAQFFVNCGDDQRAWVLVAAAPNNGDPYFIQMVAQARDSADAEAIGRALATMSVDTATLAAFTASFEAAADAAAQQAATTVPSETAPPATDTTAAP